MFFRFQGSTSYVIFNGSDYCLYSLLVLYYNRLRLFSSDSTCLDTSFLLPRTGNGATSKSSRRVFKSIFQRFSLLNPLTFLLLTAIILFFRILVADGRYAISAATLMKDVNLIYRNLGLDYNITSKSAKSLGVSTAFKLGMSDDHIRVLGRWRSISTAQHYRAIDDTTLLEIFSRIILKSSSTAVPRSLASLTDQSSSSIVSQTTPSWSSTHSAPLNRALIYHILLASGYPWPQGCPINSDGYPVPQEVPEVRTNGEDLLAIESSQSFIVTLPN